LEQKMTMITEPTQLKLLMITAIREDEVFIKDAFKKAGIAIYSSFDIQGHQSKAHGNALTNWFAMPLPEMDALLYFAFLPSEDAKTVVNLLKEVNAQDYSAHPIRSFIMEAMQAS